MVCVCEAEKLQPTTWSKTMFSVWVPSFITRTHMALAQLLKNFLMCSMCSCKGVAGLRAMARKVGTGRIPQARSSSPCSWVYDKVEVVEEASSTL